MPDVAGSAVTPMKRVMPLLANFEEWMKMATDNVSICCCPRMLILILPENQRKQLVELRPH